VERLGFDDVRVRFGTAEDDDRNELTVSLISYAGAEVVMLEKRDLKYELMKSLIRGNIEAVPDNKKSQLLNSMDSAARENLLFCVSTKRKLSSTLCS